MAEAIEFYFDFSSSYSYIGQHRMRQLAGEYGRELRWKPILLGPIFKELGSAPQSPETVKGSYLWKDVERSATDAGLPYHWPKPFPFNSLTAARVFYYIAHNDEAKSVEWAQAVFDASFGRGRDCSDATELAAVARELGHNADELLDSTNQDAIKQKLKQATGEAMQKGVFGAPTFFVDGDMYWGADRIGQIQRLLERR